MITTSLTTIVALVPEGLEPTVVGCMPLGNGVGGGGGGGGEETWWAVISCGTGMATAWGHAWAWAGATFAA